MQQKLQELIRQQPPSISPKRPAAMVMSIKRNTVDSPPKIASNTTNAGNSRAVKRQTVHPGGNFSENEDVSTLIDIRPKQLHINTQDQQQQLFMKNQEAERKSPRKKFAELLMAKRQSLNENTAPDELQQKDSIQESAQNNVSVLQNVQYLMPSHAQVTTNNSGNMKKISIKGLAQNSQQKTPLKDFSFMNNGISQLLPNDDESNEVDFSKTATQQYMMGQNMASSNQDNDVKLNSYNNSYVSSAEGNMRSQQQRVLHEPSPPLIMDMQNKTLQDFKRFQFSLTSILEFSKDDVSDPVALVRLIEQALGAKTFLNTQALSVDMIQQLLEQLIKYLQDNQEIFKDDPIKDVITKIQQMLINFFVKIEEEKQEQNQDNSIPVVSFFQQDPQTLLTALENGEVQIFHVPAAASKVQKSTDSAQMISNQVKNQQQSDADVNEIIVKIELKKFQNLIENRIKHKNNLLQSDIMRLYPMNKVADGTAIPFEVESQLAAFSINAERKQKDPDNVSPKYTKSKTKDLNQKNQELFEKTVMKASKIQNSLFNNSVALEQASILSNNQQSNLVTNKIASPKQLQDSIFMTATNQTSTEQQQQQPLQQTAAAQIQSVINHNTKSNIVQNTSSTEADYRQMPQSHLWFANRAVQAHHVSSISAPKTADETVTRTSPAFNKQAAKQKHSCKYRHFAIAKTANSQQQKQLHDSMTAVRNNNGQQKQHLPDLRNMNLQNYPFRQTPDNARNNLPFQHTANDALYQDQRLLPDVIKTPSMQGAEFGMQDGTQQFLPEPRTSDHSRTHAHMSKTFKDAPTSRSIGAYYQNRPGNLMSSQKQFMPRPYELIMTQQIQKNLLQTSLAKNKESLYTKLHKHQQQLRLQSRKNATGDTTKKPKQSEQHDETVMMENGGGSIMNRSNTVPRKEDNSIVLNNPNYNKILQRMDRQSQHTTELGRILSEVEKQKPVKKSETALYAFIRNKKKQKQQQSQQQGFEINSGVITTGL